VGATTYEEYQKYVEKDPAMERRFQKVHVEEPSEQATLAILQGLKPRYQEHHGSEIQDDALVAAAHLAARYVTDRQFPDKAIDLIDEACSTKKLQAGGEQEEKKSTIGPEDVARVSMRFIL
jgi:ATP-dependent Clp protease ATP-binding subunit ClpA